VCWCLRRRQRQMQACIQFQVGTSAIPEWTCSLRAAWHALQCHVQALNLVQTATAHYSICLVVRALPGMPCWTCFAHARLAHCDAHTTQPSVEQHRAGHRSCCAVRCCCPCYRRGHPQRSLPTCSPCASCPGAMRSCGPYCGAWQHRTHTPRQLAQAGGSSRWLHPA
jgi:hypothetical protein